jgi:hypothetical protein
MSVPAKILGFARFWGQCCSNSSYLNCNPAVLAAYQEQFSVAAAGARYRARLEELWGQRQELAGRLRWGKKAVSTNPLNSVD